MHMTMTTEYIYPKIGENFLYYIDWAVFEDVMARLAQDQYQITDFDEDSFKGTFTPSTEHELVMTTLAYDKGWKVYVDGVQVETMKAFGSLVSFYVDGKIGEEHTVEMVYSPNTFHIGLWISVISLILLILIIVFEKMLRKIPVLRTLVWVPYKEEQTQVSEVEIDADTETEDTALPPAEVCSGNEVPASTDAVDEAETDTQVEADTSPEETDTNTGEI
jgi:hypothetical protein